MHEKMKEATGIKVANCSTCLFLSDRRWYGEVDEIECMKNSKISNLRSFPFKKEQECWEPDFWSSSFTDQIVDGDESFRTAVNGFNEAVYRCTLEKKDEGNKGNQDQV